MKRYIQVKNKGIVYAEKIRRAQYVSYVQDELQACTTHGLSYIVNPLLPWPERIFWSVCFAASCIMILVLLAPLYTRFMKSPTVMIVEMDYFNWNVSYPAVTLCPRLKAHPERLQALTEEYMDKTGMNLSSYILTISATHLESLELMDLESKKYIPLIPAAEYARIAAAAFRTLHRGSVSTSTEWPVSVQPAMTEVGMCHILNSNVASFDDPFKWRGGGDGTYSKTSIDLTLHDGDFYTQIANYADMYKVYIHSPDEVPLSGSLHARHSAEGSLSLGVRLWSTAISELLVTTSLHIRKCRLLEEPISTRYPVYTYNHCMLECRIRTILRLCGCVPHFYRPLQNESICTLPELQCVIHYKKEITTLSNNPVSMRKLESRSQETFRPSEKCGCINACISDVYQLDYEDFNYLTNTKLRVFITSFPKVRVVRHIIFGMYDILLRSGGVVNLCIGSSIISVMELVVLGLRVTARTCIAVLKYKFKRFYARKMSDTTVL